MIRLDIPGREPLALEHLVLDLNGTLALDGQVLPGAYGRLVALLPAVTIHLLTADTGGNTASIADRLGIALSRIEPGDEASQKHAFVEQLGAEQVVAIGNGANDAGMLSVAALGIAVLGPEGLAIAALRGADLVVSRVEDALDLLLHPWRLVATLRQ